MCIKNCLKHRFLNLILSCWVNVNELNNLNVWFIRGNRKLPWKHFNLKWLKKRCSSLNVITENIMLVCGFVYLICSDWLNMMCELWPDCSSNFQSLWVRKMFLIWGFLTYLPSLIVTKVSWLSSPSHLQLDHHEEHLKLMFVWFLFKKTVWNIIWPIDDIKYITDLIFRIKWWFQLLQRDFFQNWFWKSLFLSNFTT